MKNSRILGFSTGALYKNLKTKEAISVIKKIGCEAIEVSLIKIDEFLGGQLERIEKNDLKDFKYVSFHAPKMDYQNDAQTYDVFEKISKFHKEIRQLDLVVFHPDNVKDFSIFDKVDFPVGLENMDHRKEEYRSADDLKAVLDKNSKFKFVLDINHAFINDPTMRLAGDFCKELGNKAAQIHLSGFKTFHDPLFETKQPEIIEAIQGLNVPIIVESVLTPETIGIERDYIVQNL